MDGHEYLAHMAQVVALAQCVEDIPVTDMLQHIGHLHTVAPILDPTSYRNGMGNLEQQEKILRGLSPFVNAVRAIKQEGVR